MPNTQTSVPAFTSGQVLTAAQMTEVNTGIPVFATTTTRDAAFGGTGEKTLAEGQFAYIEASNTTQYYDGAAWQTVGASGLIRIAGGTFTSATTISMASGVFTSTYKTYQIVFQVTSGSDCQISVRVNNAGTPRTASNYFGYSTRSGHTGVTSTTTSSGSSLNIMAMSGTYDYLAQFTGYVWSPTVATTPTQMVFIGNGSNDSNTPNYITAGGLYNVEEASDGLTFVAGASVSGFYHVYALSES